MPDLVFALIFVVAFGLGPLAGVMAIAIHTTGALGKLYSEVVESIDMAPVEGISATGGTWFERVRFGVLPQVLSNFVSYALLRLEVNVRGAAVMGFVGAGGIGEELIVAIRKFYYSDVSAILLMLVACVMVIDLVSERLRHRMLAMERGQTMRQARPQIRDRERDDDRHAKNIARRSSPNATRSAARYPQLFAADWRSRTITLSICAVALAIYVFGLLALDISPVRVFNGFGRLIDIIGLMFPPTPGNWNRFLIYLGALGQTLSIAFLGTLGAALLGVPFGFLAAKNIVANRILHFLARRSLDTVRSVDTLIWALIWINVVGLGPFAGALAIASTDFGVVRQADVRGDRDRRPQAGGGRSWRPAAVVSKSSASASCRRCCRSSPARSSTSSNRTPARRRSSASSARAASASISPSRSACSNGSRRVS